MNNFVRMQVSENQVKLVYVHPRKWWQFWKPKHYPEVLAQTDVPVPIPPGALLTLETHGSLLCAKVNDRVVLTYPKRQAAHRNQGFGMRA